MNSTQALVEGTQVQILETPNVMMRHPELVGAVGEIADAAVHPATWFTVRMPDGRLLKFQPTALRPLDAARPSRPAAVTAKAAGPSEGKQGKQEARQEQRIAEPRLGLAARTLTKGTVVVIHGTDNVQQRVPHLIGKVGVVKEAPVHPATWYKVEFDDGRVFTFRPSALRVVSGEKRRRSGSEFSDVEVGHPPSERSESNGDHGTLLSSLDPDSWIGRVVRVKGGRQAGQTGTVLRSGNGWVQLDTAVGEVAKRAYELELVDDAVGTVSSALAEQGDKPRSRSGRRLRATSIGTEDDFVLSTKRSRRESVASEHPSIDGVEVFPDSPAAPAQQHSSQPQLQPPQPQPRTKRSRTLSEATEYINGIPLVSAAQRMERAEILKKFIERQYERVKDRPNLKNVLQQLAAISYNPEHEQRMARDLLDNFCPVCFHEKSPNDKFCWNWECNISPVFRELPRAASHKESVYTDESAASDDAFGDKHVDHFHHEPQIMDVCTYLAQAAVKKVGGAVSTKSAGTKSVQNFAEDAILFRWQKWACTQPEEADVGADLEEPEPVVVRHDSSLMRDQGMKPPAAHSPVTTPVRRRQSLAESDSGRSSHEDNVSQDDDHTPTSVSAGRTQLQDLKTMHPADMAAVSALTSMPGAHKAAADYYAVAPSQPAPIAPHAATGSPAPRTFQRPLVPLPQQLPGHPPMKYPDYPVGYDGYPQPPMHFLPGHLYPHRRY